MNAHDLRNAAIASSVKLWGEVTEENSTEYINTNKAGREANHVYGYEAGYKSRDEEVRLLREALEQVLPYLKAAGTNGNHWVPIIEAALNNTK